MNAIGQFAAGMGTQVNRNVVLEPWRENTRSPDGARRNGEVAADVTFALGGGMMGVQSATMLAKKPAGLGLTGAIVSAGLLAYGAVGLVGAATGVKNLFATAPGEPNPTPGPTPGPSPEPTPGPDPTPAPGPTDPSDPAPGEPSPGQPLPGAPKPPSGTVPPPPAGPGQQPPRSHVVRPGETISFIAECNDVDWRDLYSFNRDAIGPDPDSLRVGARLEIPPHDYRGGAFEYVPSRPPGQLPTGLECAPVTGVHGDDC